MTLRHFCCVYFAACFLSLHCSSLVFAKSFPVERVIDGDTIKLADGRLVRLIGVDAPESTHPEIPVQRFSSESRKFLENLIEKFPVTLEFEKSTGQLDKYGRTLAYVYLGKTLVNEELIRRGYAYAYSRFPYKMQSRFLQLENEARSKQYGLWNYSLTDGRITHLINQYSQLNADGRAQLDLLMQALLKKYPLEGPNEK